MTVVAFGTSSPELAVSITASLNRVNDINLGNIIGSNIFNVLLILPVSAMILPIQVSVSSMIDNAFLLLAFLITFIFAYFSKLNRLFGISMVLIYFTYIINLLMRNGIV